MKMKFKKIVNRNRTTVYKPFLIMHLSEPQSPLDNVQFIRKKHLCVLHIPSATYLLNCNQTAKRFCTYCWTLYKFEGFLEMSNIVNDIKNMGISGWLNVLYILKNISICLQTFWKQWINFFSRNSDRIELKSKNQFILFHQTFICDKLNLAWSDDCSGWFTFT